MYRGKSGLNIIFLFIPIVNLVYLLKQAGNRGERGINAYGDDTVINDWDDEY